MRVTCTLQEVELTNDDDYDVDGVSATCGRCGHMTESYGTEEKSRVRCLALMRDECPRGERNFYVDESE